MSKSKAPSRLARLPAEDWTPDPIRNAYSDQLLAAGNPVGLREFLAAAILCFVAFPLIGILLALTLHYSFWVLVLFFVVGLFIGALLPLLWVQDRVRRRRNEISRALPGTLDLVAIPTQPAPPAAQATYAHPPPTTPAHTPPQTAAAQNEPAPQQPAPYTPSGAPGPPAPPRPRPPPCPRAPSPCFP